MDGEIIDWFFILCSNGLGGDDMVGVLWESISDNKSNGRRGMDLRVDLELCQLG